MRNFTAIIEKCQDTGLYVGFIPGFPGAHSQAQTL
jgi:predicted RNase H-like HicB family nuclease